MSDTNTETVDIGGVAVPKAFAERWNELLAANRKLKSSLQESQAALTLAQEEAATGSTKELETAKARIAELEGEIEKSGWANALAEDGLSDDPDVLDYLQYQYGKVAPEEGKAKLSVKEWYQGVREKNPVVQAAKKVVQASRSTKARAEGAPADPGQSTRTAPTNGKVTVTTRQPPKQIPADSGAMSADQLVQMDVRDFAANKETLRKQLFGT